jgi:hypothetical protein
LLCRAHDGCIMLYRRFKVRPGGVIPVIQRFDRDALRGASNAYRLAPQENENGTHVECNRAHSDRDTLHRYWRYVGRWIRVHIRVIFYAKAEQIFFGLFLTPIAGFYLAFTAYFGDNDAWQFEATAVAVFAVFDLVGTRVSLALIVGYLLHGLWDAVHAFNAHAGGSLLGARQTTSVPLAYGFFCATYDFLMAAYFYTRRNHWHAAWTSAKTLNGDGLI